MNTHTCRQFCGFMLLGLACVSFSGCVTKPPMTTKAQKYPLMYEEHPTTILVLPPINNTTAADAKEYYLTTVTVPLAFSGFYVIPSEITENVMKSQGLYDTEMLGNQPLDKFYDYFGADAVLFTTIRKWDKSYAVLASTLTVSVEATLKSTKTNRILWSYSGTIVADLSGGNNNAGGNAIAMLITKAVITAVNTAVADYVPYAQLANMQMLSSIPKGKYNTRHDQDGADAIIDKRVGANYSK